MNRSEQREQAFILIFQSMFAEGVDDESLALYSEVNGEIGEYANHLFSNVTEKTEELDEYISKFSNGWKIKRIPKVNVAILRLAIYEMKYENEVPVSVAINEAVELAKKYSGKEDASFINGILGSVSRSDR